MIADVSAFLIPGQQYTFTFNLSHDIPFNAPNAAQLIQDVQAVSYLSGVTVNEPLLGATTEVKFIYSGDGSDTVANAAMDIETAVEAAHTLVTFSFVQAATGTQGVIETTPSPFAGLSLPSSSLWAVAVIALLAVFVFSGGAAATRGALA